MERFARQERGQGVRLASNRHSAAVPWRLKSCYTTMSADAHKVLVHGVPDLGVLRLLRGGVCCNTDFALRLSRSEAVTLDFV